VTEWKCRWCEKMHQDSVGQERFSQSIIMQWSTGAPQVTPKNPPKTAQANFFFFVSKSIVKVIDFEARTNSWAPKSTTTVSPPIETFPLAWVHRTKLLKGKS
jgi:hypothetical protein